MRAFRNAGVVGLLLGQHRVDDVDELSRDGDERLAVGLPVGPLLGVVIVKRRLQLELGHRRQVQGPS